MGDIATTNIHHLDDDQLVEDADEALSLCDLPLDLDTNKNNPRDDHLTNILHAQSRRSSSSSSSSSEVAPEFFEFLSNHHSSNMCPADDIIFCGKLIPLKKQQKQPFAFQSLEDYPLREKRLSESLPESRSSSMFRSDTTKNSAALLRNSRSLDSQKLHSPESVEKHDVSPRKAVKPRWYYVFMFGKVKLPPAMELKDIKSRQFRWNPPVMFPIVKDDGKKVSVDRSSSDNSCSWSLLKALSCRDYSSVAVTSSFWMSPA